MAKVFNGLDNASNLDLSVSLHHQLLLLLFKSQFFLFYVIPAALIFSQWDHSIEISIRQAIELIRGSPVIQECYDIAAEYSSRACRGLGQLPDSAGRQALNELAEYVVSRRQ